MTKPLINRCRNKKKDTHDLPKVKDEQEDGDTSNAGSEDSEDTTEEACSAMLE